MRYLLFIPRSECSRKIGKDYVSKFGNFSHFESVGIIFSENELDLTCINLLYLEKGVIKNLDPKNLKCFIGRNNLVYYIEGELLNG